MANGGHWIKPPATNATVYGARKRFARIAMADAAIGRQIRNSTAEVAVIEVTCYL